MTATTGAKCRPWVQYLHDLGSASCCRFALSSSNLLCEENLALVEVFKVLPFREQAIKQLGSWRFTRYIKKKRHPNRL
ncbi:unnamed protein product [Victoria cruziana]